MTARIDHTRPFVPVRIAVLTISDTRTPKTDKSGPLLAQMIEEAGLKVLAKLDTVPRHGRAKDADDPLHAARAAEVTSLWRLGAA